MVSARSRNYQYLWTERLIHSPVWHVFCSTRHNSSSTFPKNVKEGCNHENENSYYHQDYRGFAEHVGCGNFLSAFRFMACGRIFQLFGSHLADGYRYRNHIPWPDMRQNRNNIKLWPAGGKPGLQLVNPPSDQIPPFLMDPVLPLDTPLEACPKFT